MFARIKNFFLESRDELRKVQWPTRREAVYLTILVVLVSAILAGILGGLDLGLAYLLRLLISRGA